MVVPILVVAAPAIAFTAAGLYVTGIVDPQTTVTKYFIDKTREISPEEAEKIRQEGLGYFVDGAIDDLLIEPLEEGVNIVFTEFLNTVEYLGPAIIRGVGRTYDSLRNVLRGNEVNTITAGTIIVLTIGMAVFLRNAVQVAGATVFNDSI